MRVFSSLFHRNSKENEVRCSALTEPNYLLLESWNRTIFRSPFVQTRPPTYTFCLSVLLISTSTAVANRERDGNRAVGNRLLGERERGDTSPLLLWKKKWKMYTLDMRSFGSFVLFRMGKYDCVANRNCACVGWWEYEICFLFCRLLWKKRFFLKFLSIQIEIKMDGFRSVRRRWYCFTNNMKVSC